MHSHLYILLLVLAYLCCVNGQKRTLHSELNPGCSSQCKESTLIYIQSVGSNNTYHYLWSFIENFAPAILAFESDPKAKLDIEWKNDTIENVAFTSGDVYNSFAMELSNLYFINTTKDNNEIIYTIPLERIIWQFTNYSTSDAVKFTFESPKNSPVNGTVSLSLSLFDQAGRSDSIPRLQYTQSSNVFDMTLSKIFFPLHNNKSAQAQLVSNITFAFGGKDITSNVQESISIDDEYTPGVFQRFVYNLDGKQQNNNKSAYVEWKPVAYYDSSKAIANSIKVTAPIAKKGQLSKDSILNVYFNGKKDYQVNTLNNFVFGIKDDAFDYQENRFLQFSMAFGLQKVPEETLSMTLKIVIAVGLGLPMMLFVISIIYTIIRKLRSPNDFTTLSEDTS